MSSQQRLFAAVYHLGSLALVVAIVLQIFRRIDALYPTILAVGASRICLAAWQLAQPGCSKIERSQSGLTVTIVVWASAMLLLVWARVYATRQ